MLPGKNKKELLARLYEELSTLLPVVTAAAASWDVATTVTAVHATIVEVEEMQGQNTAKAVRTPIYWVLLIFLLFTHVYCSTLGKYIVYILALVGSPSQPLGLRWATPRGGIIV